MREKISEWLSLFVDASNYRILVKRGFGNVLGVFVVFHLFASAFSTYHLLSSWLPAISQQIRQFSLNLSDSLPGDLEATWLNDQKRLEFSGANLPINLATSDLFDQAPRALPRNTLSITDQELSQELLAADFATTQLVVGSDSLASKGQGDSWTVLSFSELPDFGGNASLLAADLINLIDPTIEAFNQLIWQYWWLVFIFVIPTIMITTVFRLIIDGLLVILLIKINNYRLSIQESISLVLLMGSVAVVISQLGNLLHPGSGWPFFNIAFWVIAIYVLIINRRLFT